MSALTAHAHLDAPRIRMNAGPGDGLGSRVEIILPRPFNEKSVSSWSCGVAVSTIRVPLTDPSHDVVPFSGRHGDRLSFYAPRHAVVDSGVDARKIDHLVHSLGGGSGRLLLDFSDIGRDDRRPYQAAVSASGLLSRPPGYAAVDVQFVMDTAQRIGDDRSKRMKHLNDLLRMERKAKTLEERDEAAKRARNYAKSLRGYYEKRGQRLLSAEE